MIRPIMGLIAAAALAGCSNDTDQIALYEATNSPAELSVAPANTLVIPSLLTLPPPTPGGVNRADNGLNRSVLPLE